MQCMGTSSIESKKRGVVLAGLLRERLHASARCERRSGLVEADVPVRADTEDLQIDTACGVDGRFVVVAGVLDRRLRAVGDMDALRVESERLDDLTRDDGAVALRVRGGRCRRTRRGRSRAPGDVATRELERSAWYTGSGVDPVARPRTASGRRAISSTISVATKAPAASAFSTMTTSAMRNDLLLGDGGADQCGAECGGGGPRREQFDSLIQAE